MMFGHRGLGVRWYYAAGVFLLIAAAALRFYDLHEHPLWYDEVVAANNSRASLSDVVDYTRRRNSSPILYPLVLYAVQKVEASALSIRVVPAAASVLAVAALIFLLPRAGVSRWACLLAALMAALSVSGISNAQDAREYSIDALVAVLIVVGMLLCLQRKTGGGASARVLLCLSLFLAPLVQYGLALFGAAALGTIAVVGAGAAWRRQGSLLEHLASLEGWGRSRFGDLAWPAASLAAGSVISYAVTLRHHWTEGGFAGESYLSNYYYSGSYGDVVSLVKFASSQTVGLLQYHMPDVLAAFGLVGFGVFLVVSLKKGGLHTVTILFLLSVAIAICAAVLQVYPYGAIRQNLYLGPIVFLAFGHALHSMAGGLSSIARRAGLAPALIAVAAAAIVVAGVTDVWQNSPYVGSTKTGEVVLDVLEERVREGDMIYTSGQATEFMKFYREDKPDNYYYGGRYCRSFAKCSDEMYNLAVWSADEPDRIWIIHDRILTLEDLEGLGTQGSVERIAAGEEVSLYLIANAGESIARFKRERFDRYESLASGEPAARSDYDVYHTGSALVYVRQPCAPADLEPRFFVHLVPVDYDDLPDHRKQQGHDFDSLGFNFEPLGVSIGEKCITVFELPDYPIRRISTGQWIPGEGKLWSTGFQAAE